MKRDCGQLCRADIQATEVTHPPSERGFSPKKAKEFLLTGLQVVTVQFTFIFLALVHCLLPFGGLQYFIFNLYFLFYYVLFLLTELIRVTLVNTIAQVRRTIPQHIICALYVCAHRPRSGLHPAPFTPPHPAPPPTAPPTPATRLCVGCSE